MSLPSIAEPITKAEHHLVEKRRGLRNPFACGILHGRSIRDSFAQASFAGCSPARSRQKTRAN
jgi:hypothetical protein